MNDVPLPDMPEPPPPLPTKGTHNPRWAAFKQPVREKVYCAACALADAATHFTGGRPNLATYVRKVTGSDPEHFCYDHAEPLRKADADAKEKARHHSRVVDNTPRKRRRRAQQR